MVKKIGLGIAAAIIVIGVAVFAADSRHFNGLQKEIRTVFKGILSPRQISTLMDFRRDHHEKFQWKAGERPDLFETWKELDLSEEQQGQLLKIAGDLVDKTHPYLMTMIETGAELKRKVLDVNVLCLTEGNPHHPAINQLSTQLGTEIGEISWNLALARSQVRSVLTPEQIEIMEQHHGKHDLRMKSVIDGLPGMAEDLAALWDELNLTPHQADALEGAHRLITRYRQNQRVKQHDEWRADIVKILTSEQLTVADRFHDKQVATGGAHFLKKGEERERFLDELRLTGEQKIKLVQLVLDRRARIVPAVQDLMNAAGGLREQIHADIPERAALMAAAATLGDAIGQAAGVGIEFTVDAREVLTTKQVDLLREHINKHFDQHLEHARIVPAKLHELIDFVEELGLTPEQKDQVVKLIADKHEAQRAKHHGMKRVF
jgi:Spy/CpxP family protein refolding chaperone